MEKNIVFDEVRIVDYSGEILAKTDDVEWFVEFFKEHQDQ